MENAPQPSQDADLVIVGAGIVGLAHAVEARRRGLSVIVIDRDARAVGASIRNFGHCCITAQDGDLLDLAMVSRDGWMRTVEAAQLWANGDGTVTVARTSAELAVLGELADKRPGDVRMLTGAQTRATLGPDADPRICGGAWLVHDLRVDPRATVARIATWLAAEPGVEFRWRTSALSFAAGTVHTSRGDITAGHVLVCVGHDLDYLAPDVAERSNVRRCRLSMARVATAAPLTIGPAVLTATSMLRYAAFAAMPAIEQLRAEVAASDPDLVEIGANVMFTQLPDSTLLVGDSHHYDIPAEPFLDEPLTDLLLRRISRYIGRDDLTVTQRWQGVYAASDQGPVLVEDLAPRVTAISVTSGIGMTLSFGLADRTLTALT